MVDKVLLFIFKKLGEILFVLCLLIGFEMNTIHAQINLGAQLSVGSLDMEAPYNNYTIGFRSGFGFVVYDEIPWIKDLSWETGLKASFGQTGFFALKRGSFTVINGNYPLDNSQKFLHRFWTLNVPVKLRYNGFGFMGVTGSFELSYILDGNVYVPSLSQSDRGYNYRKYTPLLEGGLFFPISHKVIIEVIAFKAIGNRFYTAFRKDNNGNIIDLEGHTDFGFGVNITYKLN